MVDFSAILNRQVGTAERPKPLPTGTYLGRIESVPTTRTVKTKEGEKGVLAFRAALSEAMDDVDMDLLSEAGGLLTREGKAKVVSTDFWLTEDSLFRIDDFLASFGFGPDSGKSWLEIFEELPGSEVIVAIEQRSYTNNQGVEVTVSDVKRMYANT